MKRNCAKIVCQGQEITRDNIEDILARQCTIKSKSIKESTINNNEEVARCQDQCMKSIQKYMQEIATMLQNYEVQFNMQIKEPLKIRYKGCEMVFTLNSCNVVSYLY